MIDINSPIFPMVNSLFEEDCLDCMKRILGIMALVSFLLIDRLYKQRGE